MEWRFVDVYADEGITGTMVKKRENFLRMIKDCEKGKIDMILTKSVSRFARNIVDSISYIRKLKAMGIGIYFEEQNIDSLKLFYGQIKTILRRVTETPGILHVSTVPDETYYPTLNVIRAEKEADRMAERKNVDFLPIKKTDCAISSQQIRITAEHRL